MQSDALIVPNNSTNLFISDNVPSVGSGSGSGKIKQIIVVIAITVGTVIVLSGLIACFLWKRNVLQSLQKGKTEQRGIENLLIRKKSVK